MISLVSTIGRFPIRQSRRMVERGFCRAQSGEVHDQAKRVLDYWFEGCSKGDTFESSLIQRWFAGGPTLDQEITNSFQSEVEKLAAGEYREWKNHPQNSLAALILSDQFTRSIYRGTAKMFELDPLALEFAQHLLDTDMIKELGEVERIFVPLPFEHAEDIKHQNRAVELFSQFLQESKAKYAEEHQFVSCMTGTLDYAKKHRDVIAQFGRFPHRNHILGRESTPEETEGLNKGTIPKFG